MAQLVLTQFEALILFRTGIILSKSPNDAGGSPALLSLRHSLSGIFVWCDKPAERVQSVMVKALLKKI